MQHRLNAVAGEVHIGRGFDQYHTLAVVISFAVDAGKTALGNLYFQVVREYIQRLKARVVARVR